jgi:CubicO group peptidase (beta-lactamase class C family)
MPYNQGQPAIRFDIGPDNPAGGIVSNVDDMLLWCNEVIRSLKGSSQLLKQQNAAELLKANGPFTSLINPVTGGYTLGWMYDTAQLSI